MPRHHYKTVVRREHAIYTLLRRAAVALACVICIGLVFYAGKASQEGVLPPYDTSLDQLQTRIVALETERSVDARALAELRDALADSRGSIDELERELAFYRGVLAPETQSSGVLVRAPILRMGSAPGWWRYQLVAQQGGQTPRSGKVQYTGELQVTFWGQERGAPRHYTLSDLDPELSADALTMNFRYFQRREGDIVLPLGFVPERIELALQLVKPVSQSVNSSYSWREALAESSIPLAIEGT